MKFDRNHSKKRVYNLTGLDKIWVGMECRHEYVTALSLDMSVSFHRKCRDFRAVAPEHGWLHGFKRLGAGRRSHRARLPDGQAPTTVQKPANTPKSTILATGALAMASRISMHQ
jgi:hypothetical protein